jgi:8-amino-7-oxononanoate synthase
MSQNNLSVVRAEPPKAFLPDARRSAPQLSDADREARSANVYGAQIRRCLPSRRIEVTTDGHSRWVVDYATNGPFALHAREEVVHGALDAIRDFGALHVSIASARAETGIASEIAERLNEMKGPNSASRVYPTTFAANTAVAAGLATVDATLVVHPNVHATVQFALKGAVRADRIIRTKNTAKVAAEMAKTTRRPVVIVEDGLYSMGRFADFKSFQEFLDQNPKGMVWLDDAHSVGMRGKNGRGEAMDRMENYASQCIVTGSFGKAFGAAGGFLVGPRPFVQDVLQASVADRFSCNLDVAAQGAVLAAMKLLSNPKEMASLQQQLDLRLQRVDEALADAGIATEQAGTSIAFRVVRFAGPKAAIRAAESLLEDGGFMTTPVYYPTIERGGGAIRISLSVGHTMADVDALLEALIPLVTTSEPSLDAAAG